MNVLPVEQRFFEGTPCKRGHVGRRYKSTGACVECQRLHSIEKLAKKRASAVASDKDHQSGHSQEAA